MPSLFVVNFCGVFGRPNFLPTYTDGHDQHNSFATNPPGSSIGFVMRSYDLFRCSHRSPDQWQQSLMMSLLPFLRHTIPPAHRSVPPRSTCLIQDAQRRLGQIERRLADVPLTTHIQLTSSYSDRAAATAIAKSLRRIIPPAISKERIHLYADGINYAGSPCTRLLALPEHHAISLTTPSHHPLGFMPEIDRFLIQERGSFFANRGTRNGFLFGADWGFAELPALGQ